MLYLLKLNSWSGDSVEFFTVRSDSDLCFHSSFYCMMLVRTLMSLCCHVIISPSLAHGNGFPVVAERL